MSALEITLIIIGVICFFGSFFFSEKLSSSDVELIQKLSEDQVHKLIDKEIEGASDKIQGTIKDHLDDAVSELERATDRETNEKLLSMNEYSDTVLDSMNKSHDEVMFLYSMLNEKQEKMNQMSEDMQRMENELRAMKEGITKERESLEQQQIEIDEAKAESEVASKLQFEEDVTSLKEAFINKLEQEQTELAAAEDSSQGESDYRNKVLSMRQEGYSEVEIAKKLGKGLGEIKLILGLFDEE